MIRKMLKTRLGLGVVGVALFVAAQAYGGGPAVGVGIGGGGSGVRGGVGYSSGGYYGGGVRWGVTVPLNDNGNVRLGVGNGGYYPQNYNNWNHNYPRGGYGGGDYYRGTPEFYAPRGVPYVETPPAQPEPPPVPTAGQLARMTDEQLRGLLRAASEDFSRELDGFTTGESWKQHFKLAEIIAAMQKPIAASSDAAAPPFAEVLKRLDSAAKNPDYEAIAKTWGFQALHAGLREFTLPALERQGHALAAAATTFDGALDGVTTGDGWKKHFEISDLEKIGENAGAANASPSPSLEKILAKFDAVAQNPQYRVIAELDGFDASRAALQRYINVLAAERSPRTAPATLPPPPPPPSTESARDF